MKIALIGATGTIGQRILAETLMRGHHVTAVVRDTTRLTIHADNLNIVLGNVLDSNSIANAVVRHDVVISAYGPAHDNVGQLMEAARALVSGAEQAGVGRLMVVGGAGSLEVALGVQLADTPEFPEAWKSIAFAHRDTIAIYQNAKLDWTYLSPAALIAPGERTGQFRIGTTQLITNEEGESRISAEDFAVAMLDEVENPHFVRARFTVAY